MNCPNCKNEIPDNSRFCMHCGHQFPIQSKQCPWCYAAVANEALFCNKCGGKTDSLVFPSSDCRELRQLFQKAGAETDLSRSTLRQLKIAPTEEIIALLPAARSGLFGAIDKGYNSFKDLKRNENLLHSGNFSTVLTNNRFWFIEPTLSIHYEDVAGYDYRARVIEGTPRLELTHINGSVYEVQLAVTIGTGFAGSMWSIMASMDSDNIDGRQNRSKAYAFMEAIQELLQTIGDRWPDN